MLQPLRRTERRHPRFVITSIRNGEEFKRITAQPEPRWEQDWKEDSVYLSAAGRRSADLLAYSAVYAFAEEVSVAVVAGVFLDHVDDELAQ
jgi:hypothetical protein